MDCAVHATRTTRDAYIARSTGMSTVPGEIVWHGRRLAGAAVRHAVHEVATLLRRVGVKAGERLVLVVEDGPATAITVFALATMDTSIIPCDDEKTARSIAAHDGLRVISLVDVPGDPAGVVALHDAVTSVLRAAESVRPDSRAVAPVDTSAWFSRADALILHTSGSEGSPQAIVRAGAHLARNTDETIAHFGFTAGDRFLPQLPLAHQYGFSILLIAARTGGSVVFVNRRRIGEVVRAIARFGITAVDAAPRSYVAVLDHLARRPEHVARLTSVRRWGVGGEPLPRPLAERFLSMVGRALLDGYGSSEHGNIALAGVDDPDGGLLPLPMHDVSVVRADGTTAAEGEHGVVHVRGPGGEPASTGDRGCLTNGRLRVTGRVGGIHRNGHTLDIASMSARLRDAGIAAEIVDLKDEGRFWIVLEDPLRRETTWWRERLAAVLDDHELPNHIEVVRRLPLIDTLKSDREALRRLVTGLARGRARRADRSSPAGRLIARARNARAEIVSAVRTVTDDETAAADYRAMMRVLENAEGELALHAPAESRPIHVSMPANALLESFALYALVGALWSDEVVVRPARGTHHVFERVLAALGEHAGPVTLTRETHSAFIARVARRPGVYVFCGRRENLDRAASQLGREHIVIFFGRGFNPAVIGADADIAVAVSTIVSDRTANGGQDCLAPHVVFIADDVWDEARELLAVHLDRRASTPGRMPHAMRRTTIDDAADHLLRHRDHITRGGTIDIRAGIVEPAVLEFELDDMPEPREQFAPVFTLVRFRDLERVVEMLRSDRYRENALALSLWGIPTDIALSFTSDHHVAFERSVFTAVESYEPFGGSGVEAGFVSHGGRRELGPILISRAVRERPVVHVRSLEGTA